VLSLTVEFTNIQFLNYLSLGILTKSSQYIKLINVDPFRMWTPIHF